MYFEVFVNLCGADNVNEILNSHTPKIFEISTQKLVYLTSNSLFVKKVFGHKIQTSTFFHLNLLS